MSIVNREKFLHGLAKSGILGNESIKKWLAVHDAETESKDLARDLIARNVLTRWQAKMLLRGAWRLRFGNYLLTNRVERTEFGDRFTATHQQLSRDVLIQYLPTEFSDSRESQKKIFALGSKLSELDHPNLVHVYDVDEERERVYLVSEVANGRELQELLGDSLSNAAVARIVRGCLKGVHYAHSKDVVFGSISSATIVVRPDGEPKICGLTKFAVRNELAQTPPATSDDLSAVNEIAVSCLASVDESERDSEEFSKLKAAVSAIENDPKSAISALDELVRVETDSSLNGGDNKLAPEPTRLPATAHPAAAIAEPAAYDHAGGSSEPVEFAVELEQAEGFLTSLARRNPVALIATAAVTALMLIGGTVFAASKLVAQPAVTMNEAGAEAKSTGSNTQGSAKKRKRNRSAGKAASAQRPDFRRVKGALSSDTAGTIPKSATDPNANLAAIDAIFGKGEGGETNSSSIKVVKIRPTKKSTEEEPEELPEAAPIEAAPVEVAVATSIPSDAEKPEVETVKAAEMEATPAVPTEKGKQEQEYLAEGVDPFENFVTVVDLPEITDSEQISFGKLILEKRHLLGAELLSTPLVHRSKPIFEMARSADDKQVWEFSYRKKKKSSPVVVAKLQKTPDQLKFNWLPEASGIEVANYLRNCRVKISTATHSHWFTLRKPIKIDGFMLGKEKGQVNVDLGAQIKFMPSLTTLAASAGGMKFDKMDKGDSKQKAYLEPAEISPNAPSRMFFHAREDRYLSLDIGIGVRKKELTLHAALVLQPKDQPAVVLGNPNAFTQVAQQIRRTAIQAQQVARQAKQLKEQKKMKWDEEKAYADAAKKATGQAELTKYYEHVVPQLVEKEIPVTITYSLNDQHRIILAHTAETAETSKK